MKKAGGIIALIAGIFSVIAALVTLLFGGIGAAFHAQGGQEVVALGWGGVIYSFMVIVFGSIALASSSRLIPIFLIVSSLGGIILGGTLVAIFMGLSLIGGLLVLIGTIQESKKAENQDSKKHGFGWYISVVLLVLYVVMTAGGISKLFKKSDTTTAESPVAENQPVAAASDYCQSNKSKAISLDFSIRTIEKVQTETIDSINKAYGIDNAKEIVLTNIPGTVLAICSGTAYFVDDKSSDLIYVVTQLEDKTIYVGLKDMNDFGKAVFTRKTVMQFEQMAKEDKEKEQSEKNEQTANDQSTANNTTQDKTVTATTENNSVTQTVPSQKVSPSFDCAKANGFVELTICNDNELAKLDSDLQKTYQKLLTPSNKDMRRSDQLEWLKKRNQCKTRDCIKNEYVLRGTEFESEQE